MNATSTVPIVRRRLVELLQARPALAEVDVNYSRPKTVKREALHFTGFVLLSTLPTFRAGRQPRDEEYQLVGEILAGTPGQDSEQADQRAFTILAEVEDLVAAKTQLSFDDATISWIEFAGAEGGRDAPNLEGYDGHIQFRLTVRARLT